MTIAVLVTVLFVIFFLLLGRDDVPIEQPDVGPEPEQVEAAQTFEARNKAPSEAVQVADPPKTEPVTRDVYAGHQGWCAPLDRPYCHEQSECPDDPFHPGKMRCVHPYWMESEEINVCAINYPKRAERLWRRSRLAYVVDDRCDGGCDRRALTNMLALEALKESTWRPWVRHRLNPDHEANKLGHLNHAERYGHVIGEVKRMVKRGNRYVERSVDAIEYSEDGNPHYRDMYRWEYGVGLFGMNAAGFTFEWDNMAPPEVLCLEPVAIEVWLCRARRSHRKLVSGVDCDRDGSREFHGTAAVDGQQVGAPSWYDLHNAVNVGTLCPTSRARQRRFEDRAEKVGLDPFAPVAYKDLGSPIDEESQNTWAGALLQELERELPAPWEQTN